LENYEGQAAPVLEEVNFRLNEHLRLLQSCHANTALFVRTTIEEARAWDEACGR
jgi:hypothetical protein